MRFGLLYELQLPRPWHDRSEHRLIHDALAEVEIADQLGFDYLWANEHHFLEEYSHSSAPEVFLAAAAGAHQADPCRPRRRAVAARLQRAGARGRADRDARPGRQRARGMGHRVSPPRAPNWKASTSIRRSKRAQWAEATEQTANMMAMTPYPGFEGEFFSMPCRNVMPKSLQKPHPPIWVACSNKETIHAAARTGIGALAFAFVDPAEAAKWAGEYYDIIKSEECVPIGHTVNANIAMATGFSVHHDEAEAKARGVEGVPVFRFRARPFLRLWPAQARA